MTSDQLPREIPRNIIEAVGCNTWGAVTMLLILNNHHHSTQEELVAICRENLIVGPIVPEGMAELIDKGLAAQENLRYALTDYGRDLIYFFQILMNSQPNRR